MLCADSCGPLLPPLNGTVSFDTPGSSATVLCDDGFILLGGDERRTCYTGVWSDLDPTCSGKSNWILGCLSCVLEIT